MFCVCKLQSYHDNISRLKQWKIRLGLFPLKFIYNRQEERRKTEEVKWQGSLPGIKADKAHTLGSQAPIALGLVQLLGVPGSPLPGLPLMFSCACCLLSTWPASPRLQDSVQPGFPALLVPQQPRPDFCPGTWVLAGTQFLLQSPVLDCDPGWWWGRGDMFA